MDYLLCATCYFKSKKIILEKQGVPFFCKRLIYASSLSLVIKNLGFNTSGYADDNSATNTFALTFQHNMIAEQLPNLVTQIHEWMNSFFLKMNPDKTEIIMFLPQHLKDVHTINGCIFPDGTC